MLTENMLDVLVYIFDSYADTNNQTFTLSQKNKKVNLFKDLESIAVKLENNKVEATLECMQTLDILTASRIPLEWTPACRAFHPEESLRLNKAGRGFLLALEQAKLINLEIREEIIVNAMLMNAKFVSLEQLKCITLMVLCQYQMEEQPAKWLDMLINQPAVGKIH